MYFLHFVHCVNPKSKPLAVIDYQEFFHVMFSTSHIYLLLLDRTTPVIPCMFHFTVILSDIDRTILYPCCIKFMPENLCKVQDFSLVKHSHLLCKEYT